MPSYSFVCEECDHHFEIFLSISNYENHKTKCVSCKSKKIFRNYNEDCSTITSSIKKSDSELKTLGHLAARNTDRMSEDQKQALKEKHNSYREESFQNGLPAGMSKIQKPKKKTKWT
jgi:putative FmdB family regulatory protein